MKKLFLRIVSYVLMVSLIISSITYSAPARASSDSEGSTLFASSGVYVPKTTGIHRIVAVGRGGSPNFGNAYGTTNVDGYYYNKGGAGGAGYIDVILEAGKTYSISIQNGSASFAGIITATAGGNGSQFSGTGGVFYATSGSIYGEGAIPFPSNDKRVDTIQPPVGMWQNSLSVGGAGFGNGGGGIFGDNGLAHNDIYGIPKNGAGRGAPSNEQLGYGYPGAGGGGGYGGAAGFGKSGYTTRYISGNPSHTFYPGASGQPGGACVYIEEPIQYSVHHYQQDVTGTGYTLTDSQALYGIPNSYITPVAKEYIGFTCKGANETIIATPGTTIPIYYDRNTYTVSYNSNGGTAISNQSARYESTAPTPIPTKIGYSFGGWHIDEALSTPYDGAGVTEALIFYAKWNPRTDTAYKIEHYQQNISGEGYTLKEADNLIGTTDTSVSATAKPYIGFHELSTHPDRVPTGSIAPDGTLTLKLFYDRSLYSVTFDTKGGSSVPGQTGIRFEGTATEPPPPTRQGYIFGGWRADEGGTIVFSFETPITSDVTAYAAWDARTDTPYKVEHYRQEVTSNDYAHWGTEELMGTTDTTATAMAKIFTGFHEVATHPDRVATGSIAPDGSLLLRLFYDRDLHSVTFDTRGGSSVPSQTGIRFEDTATEPTPPTKQGYDFGGWWVDEGCTISFDFTVPITADVTVYASWTACTFIVTLDPNGGDKTSTSSLPVIYGRPYGDLPDATKDDFTFVGWYTQRDGGVKITSESTVNRAEDVTLYAQWASRQSGILDGEVQDSNGNPMPNAKISIRAGAVNYKSTITDTNGHFTITDVRYGTYNLVAEKDAKVVTTLFEMRSPQVAQAIILPVGKTNSVVVVEENSPEIVAGGLNDLFSHNEVYTESDVSVVDGGGKVELRLTIARTTTENGGDEGRELTEGANKPISMLLKMTVTKEIYPSGAKEPDSVENLSELPELMTIIIPLSEDQRGKTGYIVYRTHSGMVDEICQEPNAEGEHILIEDDRILLFTRKFSLYALAHDAPSIIPYVLTATATPGGTITPAGKVNAMYGESKTFTITPDTGYRIADVFVDGKSVGAVSTYKFGLVHAEHTIEAVFYCPSLLYSDLDTEKWYHEPVDYVIGHGYMLGIGRGQWAPEQLITRAEFVTVLARLHGDRLPDITPSYEDVKALAWYAPSISWAQENGVGIGYGKRRFGPNDVLTREQMVLMLYRYAGSGNPGSNGILTAYQDSGRISLWSTDAVVWAVNDELLHGDGKGCLKPAGEITRAEVAAILMRYLEKI